MFCVLFHYFFDFGQIGVVFEAQAQPMVERFRIWRRELLYPSAGGGSSGVAPAEFRIEGLYKGAQFDGGGVRGVVVPAGVDDKHKLKGWWSVAALVEGGDDPAQVFAQLGATVQLREVNAEGYGEQLDWELVLGQVRQLQGCQVAVFRGKLAAVEAKNFVEGGLEKGLAAFDGGQLFERQRAYEQAFHDAGVQLFFDCFVKNGHFVVVEHLVEYLIDDTFREAVGFLGGAACEKVKLAGALALLLESPLEGDKSLFAVAIDQGKGGHGGQV